MLLIFPSLSFIIGHISDKHLMTCFGPSILNEYKVSK